MKQYTEEQRTIALDCGVPVECVPDNPHNYDEHILVIEIERNLELLKRLRQSPLFILFQTLEEVSEEAKD